MDTFKQTNANAIGYALYCNGVLISGSSHTYHMSQPFLRQTTNAQMMDRTNTLRASKRLLFEKRISAWTYPQQRHNYEHDVILNAIYYIYHNQEVGPQNGKCQT